MAQASGVKRRYISLPEAAEYIGVNQRTLRRLISSGELRGYRLAGHRRTVRLDLHELEAAMTPIPNARGGAA